MRSTSIKRGLAALTVLAAAVVTVGLNARGADAQTPFVSTNGAYAATAGIAQQYTGSANVGPLAAATWSFSDGTSAAGISVVKTFAAPGLYAATFSVTTIYGQSFSATTSVSVAGLTPTPVFTGLGANLYAPAPNTIGRIIYPVSTVYPYTAWPYATGCIYGTVLINGTFYCR